jgi:hypothetical protein
MLNVVAVIGEWELESIRKEVGVAKPKEQEFARSVWKNQWKPKREWLVSYQRCELDISRKTDYSAIATRMKSRLCHWQHGDADAGNDADYEGKVNRPV